MKQNRNMILRNIAGTNVIIPVGQGVVDSNAMIKINETGAFILSQLETKSTVEQLLDALINEYQPENDEEIEILKNDLTAFIDQATKLQIIIL